MRKGTTIIEILIYIGLLSIFLVVIVDVFVTGVRFRLESQSSSSIQSDSQFIFAKMMHDVAEATSMSTDGTSLVLDTGTYSLANENLIFTSGGASNKLNSLDTALKNLTFTRLGNVGGVPTVQVKFDIESKIVKQGNVKESRSYQTTLGLR